MADILKEALANPENLPDDAGEKRFHALADHINQMIWVTRPDGYHEYYNRRWYEYTGVPFGSTDGEEWNGMFHPDDQDRAWARWRRSLATGESYEIEYRLRRADGVYRWNLGRAEPARNEKGEIIKWYGTCTDIQDMVDARHAAEAANQAKTEFLANMSHEIRTPMNVIVGLANILAATQPVTERQMEYVTTLKTSANTLLSLINDLLDISKIEARSLEMESISFELDTVMQQVISMITVKAREKGLEFKVDDTAVKGRSYIGDPTRLLQIVTNLCGNAVKFTNEGSVRVLMTKAPITDNREFVIISVADTGIGIPEEKLEGIFDKFTQADTSITRKYGGTGLGLAITKTFVEMMGGAVTVESKPGYGSIFTVSIPLQVDGAVVEKSPAKTPATYAPGNGPRKKVLLIEDYAPNVLVAGTFLEDFGYDYDVATNGLEAFEKAKSGDYTALLMDVQMHGLNGFDTTKLIREHEQKNNIAPSRIIGMTAHAFAADRERCLASGMDDYISKPFDPELLRQKLAEAA